MMQSSLAFTWCNKYNHGYLFIQDLLLEMCYIQVQIRKIGLNNWKVFFSHLAMRSIYLPNMSIRILFFTLVTITKLFLIELCNEVKQIAVLPENLLAPSLEDWRRRHELVARLVEQINENFGAILFIDLTWIFLTSIITFSSIILSYAFMLTVSFQFDMNRMCSDIILLELNLDPNSLDYSTIYNFIHSTNRHILQEYCILDSMSYFSAIKSLIIFAMIWFRLLIILISSCHIKEQVLSIPVPILSYVLESFFLCRDRNC